MIYYQQSPSVKLNNNPITMPHPKPDGYPWWKETPRETPEDDRPYAPPPEPPGDEPLPYREPPASGRRPGRVEIPLLPNDDKETPRRGVVVIDLKKE